MSDAEVPTESLATRVARLETQRNAAVGVGAVFAVALLGGAWNIANLTTRLDVRVDRLAADVAESSAMAARSKETGDRLTERLAAMGDRLERVDRAVTQTLPQIQQSIEALRVDLAARPLPHR